MYYVIAMVWDDSYKAPIERVAGTFERFMDAKIFKDAYNTHYSAYAYIVDSKSLLNR